MQEKDKNHTELDDFWDLSSLVPKLKKDKPQRAERPSVDGIEITVAKAAEQGNAQFADVPLTERPVSFAPLVAPPEPLFSYIPTGALIRHVRVYPWKSKYEYYEQFRLHAERLAAREGKECPYADFFSYMPQYTQLNAAQLSYYLWWRSNFRRGICLPAAYSYLLLYLYELINLDDRHQDPQTGSENMVRLWIAYRQQHPRLDVLIREWLCDFCLLHRLPPPRLDPALYRTLLAGCRLKEFYVSAEEDRDAMVKAVLLFCNNYDYTKSKFYRDDTKADYDRVLGGAVGEALDFLRESDGKHLTADDGVSTVSRDAFAGAICSWQIKRRIEVDYTSFSHTHDLRFIITDVLKYAENALRQRLGVKSRLSIYAVGVPLRQRLDAYLEKALPVRQSKQSKEEIPAYERRYDLPSTPVSFENAAAIEAESWQTTKRLVEAFEDGEIAFTPQTVCENGDFCNDPTASVPAVQPADSGGTPPPAGAAAAAASPLAAALGKLAGFLPLAKARDRAAQRAFATAHGMMPDAVADRINTAAAELMGDVILEENDGVYEIIEDYLDDLIEQGVL